MSNQSEQPNVQSGEKSDSAELKSLEDFGKLPLDQMEKELTTKDYSKVNPLNLDQEQEDSEASDEDSQNDENSQTAEQSSDDDDSQESDSSESDDSQSSDADKQKKDPSLEDRLAQLEKNYKSLQSDYTKKSQRLKELERELETRSTVSEKTEKRESEETDPELAQLKQKDPKAYDALNRMIDRIVDKRVTEKVKPVEEQVTLRKRQDNANRFNKKVEEFMSSPLKELETDMVEIINENPSEWQRVIWENENAFDLLTKELRARHTVKVADLLRKADKTANASSTKKERLDKSQVGTKTKVSQPAKDVMSRDEFKKLSLEEMEKRLPKVRN